MVVANRDRIPVHVAVRGNARIRIAMHISLCHRELGESAGLESFLYGTRVGGLRHIDPRQDMTRRTQ
jgi:hypothetical protein